MSIALAIRIAWAQVHLEVDKPVQGRIEAGRTDSFTIDVKAGCRVQYQAIGRECTP